jgi:hypothetical protein
VKIFSEVLLVLYCWLFDVLNNLREKGAERDHPLSSHPIPLTIYGKENYSNQTITNSTATPKEKRTKII